jgi:YD repeat-containing protein
LLQFALPDLHNNVTVLNARLELYEAGSTTTNTVEMGAYRVFTQWGNGVTWESTNGSTPWQYAGGDYGKPGHPEYVENKTVGASTGWRYWYPTKILQEWINGPTAPHGEGYSNFGFLIGDVEEYNVNNIVTFDGRGTTKRPALSFEWVERGIGNATNYTMLPVNASKSTDISVNAASGNLMVHTADLAIPSKGFPFHVARVFNSLAPFQFGYGDGWQDVNTAYVQTQPDGTVDYTDASGNTFVFLAREGKTTPLGLDAVLCKTGVPFPAGACPSEPLPKKAAYEVQYLKTPLNIYYKSKTGLRYPQFAEYAYSEIETAHYTTGLKLPTSWTDSALNIIAYTENATEGYTKVADPVDNALASYTEQPDAAGAPKLVEVTVGASEVTKYAYGTGAAEGLLTTITEPSGSVVKVSYNEANQVTRTEVIAAGKTSGPATTYTYYELGKAPAPCSATQKATAVKKPEGMRIVYCANVLDEVEKVAHEAVLGIGPAVTPDWTAYESEVAAAVNVVNGNAILQTEDLFLPGGLDAFAGRTLNTLSEGPGALGPGWQENWGPEVTLAEEPKGAYAFADPSGYREVFTPAEGGGYTASDPGYATLTRSGETWSLSTVAGDTYTFTSSGLLTKYEDAGGGRFEAAYESAGGGNRLATIHEEGGGSTAFTYYSYGKLAEVKTTGGEHVSYEYTTGWEPTIHLLSKVTNSVSGLTLTVSYNTSTWLPVEVAVSSGHKTKLGYDAFGRVTSIEQVDPTAGTDITTTIGYGSPTNATCEAEDVGQTIVDAGTEEEQVYCYNSSGKVTNQHVQD